MARNYGGGLSPYYTAAENTLEQYVPMPFQEMMVASNAIQARAEAIENQKMATDSLLANIEALSPEHRSYVQKQANSFRQESSALLDQYGGNASDPEYIRKQRQLIMQHANDGNFRTIASANERLKFNDNIARKMRAEGKLFTKPIFNGLDSEGNLTDNVGEIEYVNTLDKLAEEYKIAWGSMENNNKGTITNKANIDRQNARVMEALKNRSPEFTKLATAYMQQGMTADEASRKIQSDIMGLQGQYGIRSERDAGYYSHQLALSKHSMDVQEHGMKMATMRAQLAAMNPGTQAEPPQFVTQQDIITGTKLNKDKEKLVSDFRTHIDSKGNLDIKNKVLQSGAFGAHASKVNTGNQIQGKSVMETLSMMRSELGWGNKTGTAKQVADAYETMIKNDAYSPTYWVPANSSMHSNLENMFKNDFVGRHMVVDGRTKQVSKDDAIELQKNAKLQGISLASTSGKPVFKYSSSTKEDGKPVVIEVPLPDKWSNTIQNNTKLSALIQKNYDNATIERLVNSDPTYVKELNDGTLVAPRRTANGVRYAKVNRDGNGKVNYIKNNNEISYIDDALLDFNLEQELGNLTSIINFQSGK